MISHIIQRASGTGSLFQEEDDYLEMMRRIKEISKKFTLTVLSFVLMPNHMHLLIQQHHSNLPGAMRELFSRYARWHNEKYQRKGHLVGGPFQQALCLNEAYFWAVSLYMHIIPVKTGLAKKPEEYPWSSSRMFSRMKSGESLVAADRALKWIPKDLRRARRQYMLMLKRGLELPLSEVLEDPEAIERFQWQLAANCPFFRSIDPWIQKEGMDLHTIKREVNHKEMMEQMTAFVEKRAIKMSQDKEARQVLLHQLLARGYTHEEIANRLHISRKTIYNIMKWKF